MEFESFPQGGSPIAQDLPLASDPAFAFSPSAVLIRKGGGVRGRASCAEMVLAALEGNFDGVVAFVEQDFVDINAREDGANTALIAAAAGNHVRVLSYLLGKGAAVNLISDIGWSALIAASYGGHVESVELLLSAHADKSIPDNEGFTALDYVRRLLADDTERDAETSVERLRVVEELLLGFRAPAPCASVCESVDTHTRTYETSAPLGDITSRATQVQNEMTNLHVEKAKAEVATVSPTEQAENTPAGVCTHTCENATPTAAAALEDDFLPASAVIARQRLMSPAGRRTGRASLAPRASMAPRLSVVPRTHIHTNAPMEMTAATAAPAEPIKQALPAPQEPVVLVTIAGHEITWLLVALLAVAAQLALKLAGY